MRKTLAYFIIKFIYKQEVEDMAVIYATLIIKGKKKFKDVPKFLKERVRQVLIDLEAEELATDEPTDGE